MAHAAFVITAIFATAFFTRRWKLDPLATAFGSSLIYFTPGLVGAALFSYGEGLDHYYEVFVPGAYAAMGMVLLGLVIAAAIVDRSPIKMDWRPQWQFAVPGVLLAFAVISTAVSIDHTGLYFLCIDKNMTLAEIDNWYNYATVSAQLTLAAAFIHRKPWIIGVAGCLLLADMYAGFRTGVAMACLAILMISGHHLPKGRAAAVKFLIVSIVFGGTMFLAKVLIVPAKYATASYCPPAKPTTAAPSLSQPSSSASTSTATPTADVLIGTAYNLTRPNFYFLAFVSQAEPFVIQATLNEVIRRNFKTETTYLVAQLASAVPLGKTLFDIDSSNVPLFNSMVQPALFPQVTFGMASNPWAQAYAAGGLWMVAAFATGYAMMLGLLTILFNITSGAIKAGVAVISAWAGFYFHRNDLFVEIIYLKQVIYIFGASLLIAWAIHAVQCRVSSGDL